MTSKKRGYRTIKVQMSRGHEASVYTSPRTADALEKIVGDLPTYDGVKLLQILEAVYKQGQKDGARETFEQMQAALSDVKKALPRGRPAGPQTHKG